jgi:drug/metabolite transporter (DMT)-like permease
VPYLGPVDIAYYHPAVLRKALLLLVAVEGAALIVWFGAFRRHNTSVDWLAVAGAVVFFVCAALLSYNWRREERQDSDARGFEVLPHDDDE